MMMIIAVGEELVADLHSWFNARQSPTARQNKAQKANDASSWLMEWLLEMASSNFDLSA